MTWGLFAKQLMSSDITLLQDTNNIEKVYV